MTTITTRSGKGSPLTNDEVDANFTGLNSDKVETSGDSMTGDLSFGDNNKVILGSGSDLQLYHDPSVGSIIQEAGAGSLFVRASTNIQLEGVNGENMAIFNENGSVQLYYDNAEKLATFSGGVSITGTVASDGLSMGDGDIATFGNSNDLQIYHDGSHSYIVDAGTGNMYLSTNGNGIVMQASLSETMFSALPNGSVRLYHDNSQKLETTSTGIDVTGTVTADGLTVNSGGDQEVYFGDNADGVALSNTGALSRLEFGGSQTTGGVAHFEYNRANGSTVFAQGTNGSETTRMQLANGGDISFYNSAGTSQDLYWDASSSRLGLGETNPSHELHIKSVSPQIRLEDSDGTNTYSDLQYNGVSLNIISRGGASSYGAITFARTDGTNTYNTAQINAAGDFRFYNNSGTAKMRWDASAEALGIGIETPAEELHISAAVPTIRLEDSDGTNQYLNIYESGGGANYLARNNTSYGTHNFYGYDGTTSTSFINITLDAVNQNTSAAWYIRNRVSGGSLNLGVETSGGALYYPVAMSGTSNILVFNNATDEIARFLSNGNFGIGTDSAQSILEIQDANAQLTIDSELSQFSRVVHQHNGTSVWTTGTRSASDYHIFRESGSGNVIIDQSSLGIGASSPADAITIGNGTSSSQGIGFVSTNTGNNYIHFGDSDSATAGKILYDHANDNVQFYTGGTLRGFYNANGLTVSVNTGGVSQTSHFFTYNENGGELQLYDNNGQAATLLDQSSNATRLLEIQNGSTMQVGLGGSNTTGIVEFRSAGFGLAGVIDANANWLFNTNNSSGTAGAGVKITRPSTSGNDDGKLMIVGESSTSAQDGLQIYSTGASAYRFFVNYAGSIYATSTSITAISDESLKENIRDLDKGLDTVLALQPRRFDWKNGDGNDIMGFVAQEVEEVMPELVHDFKYSETETKLGLKMGDMVPTLVKAIQDQQEIIENLKSRIEQLEGAN